MAEFLDHLVREGAQALSEAEVPSPRIDAELLAAHALGLSRGELAVKALTHLQVSQEDAERFRDLVAERRGRTPLQHLTGAAPFRTLELRVGPGVFIPRPETESVVELVLEDLSMLIDQGVKSPRVIDLGTGSGAIAASVAVEFPTAEVHAVELSEEAAAWAEMNFATLPHGSAEVTLHRGDLRSAPQLLGRSPALSLGFPASDGAASPAQQRIPQEGWPGAFDVVVSNPPYIPATMVPRDPEVAEHDPELALYGGGVDGMELPLAVLAAAEGLLRPGGRIIVEHAEVQASEFARRCAEDFPFSEVRTHRDLSGRDRATSAVLRQPAAPDVEEWRA